MGVLKILYVEDVDDLRETVGEMLEADGREFVALADGESALQAWQDRRFDVLLTDISLPGMSGIELARLILAERPDQWVIFCSGYEYHQALSELGPNVRVMAKAFEFEQMDALLDEIAGTLAGGQSK